MAEQTTPLAATIEAFDHARGEDMDGAWAHSVSWTLMMRDVDADLVRDGLEQALALVRDSGESPTELFGSAREHALALYDQWLAEGRLTLTAGSHTTWRGAVLLGLGMSAAYAVLFGGVLLVRGDLRSGALGWALLVALVLGMGGALGLAAWSMRHRRPAPDPDGPAEQRWATELTEVLRTHYSLSGRRVRDIVAEACAHAAESGRTVSEEFGTPREYAARFAPDLARRSLLTTCLLGSLALVSAILFLDGPRWSNAGLLLGFGWLALAEHRRYRTLRAS